jgi:hypothetical protein
LANEGSYNYTVTPLDWEGQPSFIPVTDIYKDPEAVGTPLGEFLTQENRKRVLYGALGALVAVVLLKWMGR